MAGRRTFIHDDLMRTDGRRPARLERERGQVRGPGTSDRGGAPGLDDLARRRIDDLRERLHRALGEPHAGHGPDRREEALRDGVQLLTAASPAASSLGRIERLVRLHHDVGVRVHLAEEIIEALESRVGQDERACGEAHPEDDRQRRQDQSQLPGQEALDGGAEHSLRPRVT